MIKAIFSKKIILVIFLVTIKAIFPQKNGDNFGNYKSRISKKDFGDVFGTDKSNMSKKEFGDFLVVIKIFFVITRQLSICYKIFIMIALIILGTLVLTAKSFYELTFWFSPRVFFCLFERMKNPK